MDPIRISIVFDAQGQPQLQRANQSLAAMSQHLTALSGSSSTAGRALRVMETDLNRYATSMHRTATTGLGAFNSAFDRTYALMGQVARISFYAAVGQVAALGFSLRGLAREFFSINEEFSGLEITLKSMFGSLDAARKVREELARITISSPLPFKDLADATRAAAAMPSLAPKFAKQIQGGTLSDPSGFMRQYVGLLEKMVTFRPDKNTSDAVFALREAISGELRSLVRRFEFPASLLVQSSGKPLDYLKKRPEEMLQAMTGAFTRMISDKATLEVSRQPSKLWQNIKEQALQIPLLQIGRAGEKEGKPSLYQHVLDTGIGLLARFGEFANIDKGPFAKRAQGIGDTGIRLFDAVVQKLDSVLERFLNFAGAGQKDTPGADKITRVYLVFENILLSLEERLPAITKTLSEAWNILFPLFTWFGKQLLWIADILKSAFSFSPVAGIAALALLKNLPSVVRGFSNLSLDAIIKGAQNARAAVLAAQSGPMGRVLASQAAIGSAGIAGAVANAATAGGAGTFQATLGRNPFLYNREVMSAAGIEFDAARNRLVHTTGGAKTGYFGQEYIARAGSRVSPQQLPSGMMLANNQRIEQVLARNNMAFDRVANALVYTAGSGHFPGVPVPVGLRPRLTPDMVDASGLPPGYSVGANNAFRGPGGRFVSPAVVAAAMPVNYVPRQTAAEVRQETRARLTAGGSGVVAAGVGAGVAGLFTGAGASAGVAGAVGGFTASVATVVTPILIAMVAAGAIALIYDKVSAYAATKRREEGEETLARMGLDPRKQDVMQERMSAENAYFRQLSQLAKDTDSPALSRYKEIATLPDEKISLPRSAELTREIRPDSVSNSGIVYSSTSVPAVNIGYEYKNVSIQELNAARNAAYRDIMQLQKAVGNRGEGYQPITLESLKQRRTDGTVSNDPLVIPTFEHVDAALKSMLEFFVASGKRIDAFAERTKKLVVNESGDPLVSYGVPLNESEKTRVERMTTKLNELSTPKGFREQSKRWTHIEEQMKAFEISPNLRSSIERNEGVSQSVATALNPMQPLQSLYSNEGGETARGESLRQLSVSFRKMATSTAEGPSSFDMSVKEGREKVDALLEEYKQLKAKKTIDPATGVAEYMIQRPVMEHGKPVLAADGVTPMMEPVPFEKYAEEVRESITKFGTVMVKEIADQIDAARMSLPGLFAESIAFDAFSQFDKLLEAPASVVKDIVTQLQDTFKLLRARIAQANDDVVSPEVDAALSGSMAALEDMPMGPVRTPGERTINTAQRQGSILKSAELFQEALNRLNTGNQVVDTGIEPALKAVGNLVKTLSRSVNVSADKSDMAKAEAELTAQGQVFAELLSGGITPRTEDRDQRLQDVIKFAKEKYGATLPVNLLSFTAAPTADFQKSSDDPFAREEGLLSVLDVLRASLKVQKDALDAQLKNSDLPAAQRIVIETRQQEVTQALNEFTKERSSLETETSSRKTEYRATKFEGALSTMREMTDPSLGYKLGRGGSLKSEVQWQTGKYGEADNRVSVLQEKFDKLNEASGSKLAMTPKFRSALEIDARGFKAVTGEVERLTAFQEQYVANAKVIEQQASGAFREDAENLLSLAAAWKKMADEAQRSREAITGRGGILATFSEGFGATVSQWNATMGNWTSIGASSAQLLSSSISDSLIDIAVHSKDAGEAFKQFGAVFAETVARMAMNKAVESLLGAAFSGIGGLIGGGAKIPSAMSSTTVTGVTGTTLNSSINVPDMSLSPKGFAEGGLLPGSPSRTDNMIAHVASGEYIIPTAAVQKYGVSMFDSIRDQSLPVKSYATGGLIGDRPAVPISSLSGGGSSSVNAPVNVTVNIDSAGNAQPDTQANTADRAEAFARSMSAAVRQQIMREQRQGGALYSMSRGKRK